MPGRCPIEYSVRSIHDGGGIVGLSHRFVLGIKGIKQSETLHEAGVFPLFSLDGK